MIARIIARSLALLPRSRTNPASIFSMLIVSTVGGLPEYRPPGCPPVRVNDVAGLATAFDDLADPFTATLRGAAAARHYADRFAVDSAADGLLNVLLEVLSPRLNHAPS